MLKAIRSTFYCIKTEITLGLVPWIIPIFINRWTARRRRFFNPPRRKRARGIIFAENPAQPIEKAHFGRENPRKSKLFQPPNRGIPRRKSQHPRKPKPRGRRSPPRGAARAVKGLEGKPIAGRRAGLRGGLELYRFRSNRNRVGRLRFAVAARARPPPVRSAGACRSRARPRAEPRGAPGRPPIRAPAAPLAGGRRSRRRSASRTP